MKNYILPSQIVARYLFSYSKAIWHLSMDYQGI